MTDNSKRDIAANKEECDTEAPRVETERMMVHRHRKEIISMGQRPGTQIWDFWDKAYLGFLI